jgi:predicted SAM-dependent methyltransferase
MQRFRKLHLGCGPRHLEGWANIDISPAARIVWDLRKPLPVSRVGWVYSEHFIEHIAREDAVRLLTNVRRVLTDEGVVRISTPDLAALVEDYRAGILADMPEDGWQPKSLCQMLNEGMREWGHTFLYDEPELRDVLAEAGFGRIERVRHSESAHAELRNLESRPDLGDLILEARP